jgi:ligand-binding sensor domain-containing protein/signal transduction histidine kinase/DNA-binding response OmpR family regulator
MILLLLVTTPVAAQNYSFRHYQVENGLSNNTVYCSIQDKKGFLWFGTKDGLNRFDGYHFKTYTVPAKGHDLTSYFISCLLIDTADVLWVGCRNGLFSFDSRKERLVLFSDQLPEINALQTDGQGQLWFISRSTLCRYNFNTKKLTTFPPPAYFNATSLCRDKRGDIWVGTSNGWIQHFDAVAETFKGYHVFAHSPKAPSNWILKLMATDNQTIYVGTFNQGLKEFDITTGSYTDILTYNADKTTIAIRDILPYSAHEWWLASESGIFILDTRTKQVTNLRKRVADPYSLTDNAVYTLCKDREGGIWAGTYFGGVNYYSKQYDRFYKYFPDNTTNSIGGSIVREICEDGDGNIWIGTEDAGLNKLNLEKGTITQFTPTGNTHGISYSNIHGLLINGKELWIGTFENGLDIMDIKTGKVIKHYTAGPGAHELKSNFIVSLLQTRSGNIYAGTSNSLFQFNRASDGFTQVPQIPAGTFISCLLEDKTKTIWAGTHDRGIYYFNPATNAWGHFENQPTTENSLSSNTINAIYEDDEQNLWLSTEGGGLCTLNKERNTFSRITIKDGLPSNFVFKVLEDDKKNVWISTSRGLVSFNRRHKSFVTYTRNNGLLNDQFNYNSGYKDSSGRMYFGSVKGMTTFHPDELVTAATIPPVFITGFQVQNKEADIDQDGSLIQQSILYTHTVTLPYDKSSFSIDFAALSYTSPEMTTYSYMMEGLDNEWTILKSNRKLYFTNLEPGNYRLMVKAMNSVGEWTNQPASLQIIVTPPLWKSMPAYFVYVLLVVLITWLTVRKYRQQTKLRHQRSMEILENEKDKEIYRSKIEFFTNVAHEIRTPLTLIKLPLDKIMTTPLLTDAIKDNLTIMEKNTNRLIDLTNQLLDFRKTENNSVSLSYVKTDIAELLEQIYISFKPAAEQKDLQFKMEMPRMHFQAYVDPEAVKKIISNLLNNAIKYSDHYVLIKILPFSSEDNFFSIRVSNDGFLIPHHLKEKIFEPFFRMKESEKEQGTGIGLALALSLTQLHKGTLSVETDDRLNSFLLTLPIHQETEFELFREEAQALQPGLAQEEIEEDNDRHVILLVEDNKDILDFIAKDLAAEYTVIKAQHGAEAIKKIATANVQLIISDIMMPVMDGYSLCKEVKSNVEYSHIPVILLTAKTSLQAKIEGLEMGADAYIEKPFSQPHLLAQIKSLLNNRDKIKEHFANSPLVNIKTMAYSKADEKFLITINDIIHSNISHPEFNVDQLAKKMNMSRPTLYRKIRGLSNLTPNDLINITRLKKAAELLAEGDYKIYEVAEMVGYSLAANFSRDFMKQFGISPSDYAVGKRVKV